MASTVLAPTSSIDLTNCEQEPIHIPGCIQPHGLLLVLAGPDLHLIHVSDNLFTLLGKHPHTVLNQPLETLFDTDPDLVADFRRYAGLADITAINPVPLHLRSSTTEIRSFNAVFHRVDQGIVCELEPAGPTNADTRVSTMLRHALTTMSTADSLHELCRRTVDEVRQLSGFDRVMMYQFDEAWNGRVIAESKVDDIGSYLNLHFPASDIPKQARALYLRNWVRVIVDVDYVPVPIVPQRHPQSGQPLDLSAASLRSVSPMHLQYLKNMGVQATLTISLINDNALWGMIVCHHRTPRLVPYAMRVACELIGQLCSAYVTVKQDRDDAEYEQQVRSSLAQVLAAMSRYAHTQLTDLLVEHMPALMNMVGAAGVAIWIEDTCVLHGTTPERAAVEALVDWLADQQDEVVATDALRSLCAAGEIDQAVVSGLLAIAVAKQDRHYVLWFRPEVIQTVAWGGDPHKPVEVSRDGIYLSPRRSFEHWKETVRGRALAWKSCEIAAATTLRLKLIDYALEYSAAVKRHQQELIRMQQVLLAELSTPLIPINEDVLVMPLIGTVDSQRAQQVLETLLAGIAESGAQTAILDITGVVVVDTQVANALVQAAQAVQLLGAQVILTGIRPEVAQTIIGLGIDLQGLVTRANLQAGIAYAVASERGMHWIKRPRSA